MSYDRLVMLDDTVKSWTFRAGDTVSGGDFVGFTSGTDIVTSGGGMGGWAWNDVTVDSGSVGSANFVGIALHNAGSGTAVGVALNGIFVVQAGAGGITGGQQIQVVGQTGSFHIETCQSAGVLGSSQPIGRALSTATANTGFAIVRLY